MVTQERLIPSSHSLTYSPGQHDHVLLSVHICDYHSGEVHNYQAVQLTTPHLSSLSSHSAIVST